MPAQESQRELSQGILGVTNEELVSTDFIHDNRSSITTASRRCRTT